VTPLTISLPGELHLLLLTFGAHGGIIVPIIAVGVAAGLQTLNAVGGSGREVSGDKVVAHYGNKAPKPIAPSTYPALDKAHDCRRKELVGEADDEKLDSSFQGLLFREATESGSC
jgi:hypothetical protein